MEPNRHFKDDLLNRAGELRLCCFKGSGPAGPGQVFDDVDAADAWAAEQNADWNVYVHANTGTSDARNKRLTKQGTTRLVAHVVDLDPPKDSAPETWKAWRSEALAAIYALQLTPTWVIDSGRGYQVWWMITAPQDVDDVAAIEGRSRALGSLFADLTDDVAFTIDHIWRWPGTRNLKPGAGQAKVVLGPGPYYDPDDLPTTEAEALAEPDIQDLGYVDVTRVEGLKDRTQVIVTQGLDPDEPDRHPSRSEWLFDAVCNLLREGATDSQVYSIITDPSYKISESVLEASNVDAYARRQIRSAKANLAADEQDLLLDPQNADRSARLFLEKCYPHLIHSARVFTDYVGPAWRELEDGTVRQALQVWLRDAEVLAGKDGARKQFPINDTTKKNIMGALEDHAHRPTGTYSPPCWLNGAGPFPAREVIACRNKLVNVRTGETCDPTPDFFTFVASPFDYQPELGDAAPASLQAFMDSIWPDHPELQDLMQEIVGYLLLPVNRYQKMFLLMGASRGGKGTWVRLIQSLIGEGGFTTATAQSLCRPSGLSSFPAAGVAFLPDMRIGPKTDRDAVMERLLGITGGDALPIERKYKDPIPMILNTRLVVLSNEVPRWVDGYGALANRTIPIPFEVSFMGREDPDLDARLAADAAAIFNWALAGLRRLLDRDRFDVPQVCQDLLETVRAETGGVEAFIRDCCEIVPGADTPTGEMYETYRAWAEAKGATTRDKVWFARLMVGAARGRYARQESSTIDRWEGIRIAGSDLPF